MDLIDQHDTVLAGTRDEICRTRRMSMATGIVRLFIYLFYLFIYSFVIALSLTYIQVTSKTIST